MSERMIELQRARMLNHATGVVRGSKDCRRGAVVSTFETEGQQLQRFLARIGRRDDCHQAVVDSSSGPTVPTALTRRLLHRQGVGYIDEAVAAIAAASADRFLATVLHQAMACRDQRLKGVAMERGARGHRKRHIEQYLVNKNDRWRQKKEDESRRERTMITAIAAADATKKGGSSKKSTEVTRKMKKKKKASPSAQEMLSVSNKAEIEVAYSSGRSDDGFLRGSLQEIEEEEEEFYQVFCDSHAESDDSDDDDETLDIVDVRRPLWAWGFHITGKSGLESTPAMSHEDNRESGNSEKLEINNRADGVVIKRRGTSVENDQEQSASEDTPLLCSSKRSFKTAPKSAN